MIYNFHGSYTPDDKEVFQQAQEEDLSKVCEYLQTSKDILEKITFEVFDTREGKQEYDPHHSISRASARFAEMKIYRFWLPTDDHHYPHEMTHLVAHTWAKPYSWEVELDTWDGKKIKMSLEMVSTSFMQEGLAIAVDDIIFGRKLVENNEVKLIDDWCRMQIASMPKSLSQVLNIDGFGSMPNNVVVPFSASFSKFLLLTYGVDLYRKMYISLKETFPPENNARIIEVVYERSQHELFTLWQGSLNRG